MNKKILHSLLSLLGGQRLGHSRRESWAWEVHECWERMGDREVLMQWEGNGGEWGWDRVTESPQHPSLRTR